ncbi:putative Pentatricopeptide repeat-containing protein [Cocos nucifera]|uniref:Putative Pentatricopeptide repeat-containing protein n=1 Tax=Cocos nucifera TaxID=13894 RepID=A0A8K0ND59_COCNU|nr:putative Pentatricopeptide repeat-containing protein [Cocos nucifera]
MPVRSIVSWNTMIAGHTHYGEDREALKLFLQMHREGTTLSEFTLSSVLCTCASRCAIIESKPLHALALKTAMDSNVFVGTAVLDVYAKCNMIDDACLVFDKMPEKSSVTWSSMVAGYVQNDLHEEALRLFHKAQLIGVELTQYTLSAILSACASLAATIEGTQLHAISIRSGLNTDVFVATALIDVYSRCGCVEEAYLVFAYMEDKNIVLWNAMIAGFSRHVRFHEAMILFEKMQQLGMHPNEVTYISVLSACGHVGLVEKGHHYFDLLMRDNWVQPNVLHYSCMVDVLGRAGHIDEAWELIQKMPFKATASMWGSLLSSCRIHGNLKLAKTAAKHLFELEPNNAGNHVLLSNIYAANKKWGDVSMARKLLKDTGAKKEIGKSWIEMKGKVHIFVVGESNHARTAEIYAKLEDIGNELKKLSYKAETQYDLHDVGEEQKEELLKHHSEKLALAFGLISLPPGMPIRINKNLRICGDCHSFIKLASRITGCTVKYEKPGLRALQGHGKGGVTQSRSGEEKDDSSSGSLTLAKWVDSYIAHSPIDVKSAHVLAALIDMNAKCGNMERASFLFESMQRRDLISYCSMMQGYSIHGAGAKAVDLFFQMLQEGILPDEVAFTVVLTACSHAGLVEEGYKYFELMKNDYIVVPSPDHYACVVDLLGRAGRLEEAYKLIKSMPLEPHAGAWGALLAPSIIDAKLPFLMMLPPAPSHMFVLKNTAIMLTPRGLIVLVILDLAGSKMAASLRDSEVYSFPDVIFIGDIAMDEGDDVVRANGASNRATKVIEDVGNHDLGAMLWENNWESPS